MACDNGPDCHQKSFRIKPDDEKLFNRLLSRERSKSKPSFRVYYGDVSSAVPFTWETRPGTPKHAFSDSSHIPPLTPPPSYHTNNVNLNQSKVHDHSRSRLYFLKTLLGRIKTKKAHFVAQPQSPDVDSSSSYSSSFSDCRMMSSPSSGGHGGRLRRRRFASWGSSCDGRGMWRGQVWDTRSCVGIDEDEDVMKGERVIKGSGHVVKRALLSIVGRGST